MRLTFDSSVLTLGAEDRVDLGGGIKGPPSFDFWWEPGSPDKVERIVAAWDPESLDGNGHAAKFHVEHKDGRYAVTELTVIGKVTSEILHAIPVRQVIREAVPAAVSRLESIGDGSSKIRGGIMGSEWVDPHVAKDGPTEEALQAVATIYRLAYAAGDPPTKAVATVLELAESTAARWVGKSRQAGYLGPTKKGKAGA